MNGWNIAQRVRFSRGAAVRRGDTDKGLHCVSAAEQPEVTPGRHFFLTVPDMVNLPGSGRAERGIHKMTKLCGRIFDRLRNRHVIRRAIAQRENAVPRVF